MCCSRQKRSKRRAPDINWRRPKKKTKRTSYSAVFLLPYGGSFLRSRGCPDAMGAGGLEKMAEGRQAGNSHRKVCRLLASPLVAGQAQQPSQIPESNKCCSSFGARKEQGQACQLSRRDSSRACDLTRAQSQRTTGNSVLAVSGNYWYTSTAGLNLRRLPSPCRRGPTLTVCP